MLTEKCDVRVQLFISDSELKRLSEQENVFQFEMAF